MRKTVFVLLISALFLCFVLPCSAANSIERNFEIVESYIRNPETENKNAALRSLDAIREYITKNQVTIKASVLGDDAEYSGTAVYIMNTHTKKFHLPSCRYVKQIQQTNRQEFSGTRDELLKAGYTSCGTCDP